MDSKFIERPKKFNQKEYNKNYRKDHYNTFSTTVKPELKNRIDFYCQCKGISKAEFLQLAIDTLEML